MLHEIRLQQFKSFAEQRVRLAPLTLLVGPNGAGKSNLIDAIGVLRGLSIGFEIDEVLQGVLRGGVPVWPGIRGGVAEAARARGGSFTIETAWDTDGLRITHEIAVSIGPGSAAIADETMRGPGPAIEAHEPHASLLGNAQQPEASRLGKLQRCVRSLTSLEVVPSAMRGSGYVPRTAHQLGDRGENLSAVLRRFCEDEARKMDLLDWLSALVAPPVADLEFVETEAGDVMLRVVEADGTRVAIRSLSDGTLRFLGLLTAVLTLPAGSIVLLEEPDVGLHPARVHLLAELLEGVGRRRDLQIIATTHSPILLASLGKDALGDAIAFARSSATGATEMRRLRDLPSFEEIEGRRGIEYLFTTEWLERAL
jgi:predicted ATPase